MVGWNWTGGGGTKRRMGPGQLVGVAGDVISSDMFVTEKAEARD
jgi:hypothetical protein